MSFDKFHKQSELISDLATALAVAQSELEHAHKSSTNPFFKSKYADLSEVINTVRPVFNKHNLSVVQLPSYNETQTEDGKTLRGHAMVETMLIHKSGQWISSISSAPVSKMDAQGVGAAITYLRRYALAALACIAQEDDDGESAVGRKQTQQMVSDSTMKELVSLRDSSDSRRDAYNQCLQKLGLTAAFPDISKLTQEQADKIIAYVSNK